MRFWDSSALLSVAFHEELAERLTLLLRTDRQFALWWGTLVESEAAISRVDRGRRLSPPIRNDARAFLDWVREDAVEIEPSGELRAHAVRLVKDHPLRAADALQLAAALVWCSERTAGASFVCLDDRLREAASREGFTVLPYPDAVHEV